jgi:hypothetical protein
MFTLWHLWPVYKPITIVNDDSRVVKKLETSLSDDARVFIYDRRMFIVQAADVLINYGRNLRRFVIN